ncbi:MAG: radical SAM protein [Desulfuromonadales bacterium]|nr:radical SAM protein [Desulfuromonadales bacterium]
MKTVNSRDEKSKRNLLHQEKPYVYEKIMKFDEKVRRGESIAIIQLQYNYACNMVCQHCSIKGLQDQNNEAKRKMTPADVRELARQADELGLARFEINGGEPFVNTDYDEIVAAIDPQKFYINSVTNGWLLDEKLAHHLKAIGVDRIQISVDSLNAEEHDEFRQRRGSHARALQAVEAARNAGLAVFVSTVVTKQRLYSDEFIDFIKFFNGKDIGVFLTFAKPVGAWQGKYDMMVNDEDLAYVKELETRHKIFSHLTPSYGLNLGCTAVKGMVCVTQYGDVMPCQYIFVSLGNIFETPLKDIIQKGLSIKWFGEHVDDCPIANDKDFIDKYIAGRVYDKPLPVPCDEVFTEEDRTNKSFKESL